jgi:hypothetical protein
LEEPVEMSAHDDNPDFLKDHLNGFSFNNVRNKGRKGCGCKKDVKAPVRKSGSVLNGVPFVSTMPTAGTGAQSVKPNSPEKKLTCSVNAVVQVMFSKTAVELR